MFARLRFVRCGRKMKGSAPVSELNDKSKVVRVLPNVELANNGSTAMLRF